MKKLLLFLFLISSSIFAQNLTKEELIEKMSDVGCECANRQEITKDNMEMTLGLCIIEAINKYQVDVEKYYGKNVITDNKKMEELGYDIGFKMGVKCPAVFKFMAEESSNGDSEDYAEEVQDLMIAGKLTEIKSEQFLTFSVKEISGKVNRFILLNNFENAFLLTDKVLKNNDNLEVYYYELELFDAKSAKFVTFKVVTDIIKK